MTYPEAGRSALTPPEGGRPLPLHAVPRPVASRRACRGMPGKLASAADSGSDAAMGKAEKPRRQADKVRGAGGGGAGPRCRGPRPAAGGPSRPVPCRADASRAGSGARSLGAQGRDSRGASASGGAGPAAEPQPTSRARHTWGARGAPPRKGTGTGKGWLPFAPSLQDRGERRLSCLLVLGATLVRRSGRTPADSGTVWESSLPPPASEANALPP